MRCVALVALFWAVTVVAGPAAPTSRELYKCAGYCKAGTKLSYEVGSSYVYEYTADTVTSVNGAGNEAASLHLSATVEIHSVSQCDLTMQLRNVRLEDSSHSEPGTRSSVSQLVEFSAALERNSLLFSFHDGLIDELCATSTDPVWVLNIKRGVLSAFQNSMKRLDTDHKVYESDVTGDCETQYTVMSNSEENLVEVEKSKNLLACSRRMDHFLSLQSTPYNSPSRAQSLPLVKSDHKCYQNYREGILQVALCVESHQFRPFSNGDNGAVTKVLQNLVYQTTETEGRPGKAGVSTTRTTLHFQHTLEESDALSRAQTIATALEELDAKTKNGVESDVPRVFSGLVATLRTTSYPTLAKVFSHTRNQHTRKFLLDAMPLVGTADGLTVMTDLYKSGEITEAELDSWLTSLTFIKKPTITMLLAVSSLLDGEPRPKAVLGISALVHSYCQWDADCHKKEAVIESINKMERMLGEGCHVKGRQDMESKILALKGIGNAGVFPSDLRTIRQCYQRSDIPLEVRLAAIGAHRRFPCHEAWRSGLLRVYTDMKQDSETRIAAYLAVMQCPAAGALQTIKATLYSEEVNQVASFVWTHLTNIQESSSRWKQSIRDLISNDFLRNKFQTDARKFSRNYEGSAFADSFNAGATVESNVIFSPQSYLPRSAMLNLTLDLFGESINVFEVGTRAEGFEQIIEDMFGPGGYFPDKSLKQVLQKARGSSDNELENSIDQLADTFNSNNKLAKEPQASLYARVFGNEIHYSRYQGIEEMMGGHPHVKNPLEFIAQLFGGQDVDFTNSFVFIDASYKIPTIIGLPLDFSVNGSATVGLKMNGQVDLRDLWRKNAFNIQGQIMPSAAVEVTGTMSIDAFVTKSGLQTVSTLHTNTYVDGKVTVMGGQLVDVQMNVPREKVEVLEVTSRMFVLHRNAALELEGVLEDREEYLDCSLDSVAKITGMKLCTELAYPNASLITGSPYFPLTGPVTLRVNLLKTDVFDSYKLLFQQLASDDSVRSFILSLDTPNSRINRKVEGAVSLDLEERSFVGSLLTPFVKLEMQSKLDYDDASKSVSFGLRKNDEDVLKTRLALATTNSGRLKRYEPSFSLSIPNTLTIDLVGKINYVEGTKYSADFSLTGLTDHPLLFSADVNADGNKYELVGLVKSPLVEGSIHANLRQTKSYVSTKVTVEYALRQSELQTISLAAKVQSNYKGDLYKRSAYGSLQVSAAPQYNVLVSWDIMSSDNYVEHAGRLGLGPTEWQIRQLYQFNVRGNDVNFAVLCHFNCPAKNVDYQFDVQYKTTESSIKSHALAQLNAKHRFYSTVNYLRVDNQQELSAEVTCPWFSTLLNGEIVETQPNHFSTKMEGRHTTVGARGNPHMRSLSLSSVYVDGSTDTHQDHKLDVELSGELSAALSAGLTAAADKSNQWLEVRAPGRRYRADVTYTKNTHYIIESTFQLVDRTYHSKVVLLLSDKYKSLDVDLHLSKRLLFNAAIFNDGVDNGVSLELFWDRDGDLNKRIALSAHANAVTQGALLEFPGQYIKGELITLPNNISALLEWAEDQKILVNLEWNTHADGAVARGSLTTPFDNLKSQNATAKYTYGATNCNVEVNMAWQDQELVFIASGDNLNSEGTIGVEIQMTSTLTSLSDVHVNMKHTYQPALKQFVYSIQYNNQKIVDATWHSQNADVRAELLIAKPSHTLPVLHGKLNSQNGNLTVVINYASDRSVLLQLTTDLQFSKSGLFQIITPYSGLKNVTAVFSYFNNGVDLKITADMDHNNKTSSLLFSGSKATKFILGSGILTTPFMKPFEAGFTHSTERGFFKEGLSVTLDGQQMVLVSLVGTVHSFGNMKLTTDLTMQSQSVIGSFENRLGASSFESLFEGVWNEDQVAASIVAEYTKQDIQFIATASGSALSQEVKIAMVHKRIPGLQYSTMVQLPGDVVMSHTLLMEDSANWENTINIKTPLKNGLVSNKQSLKYDNLELKFEHAMVVEQNGPQATVQVNYVLDSRSKILKNADGILTTSWTNPIIIDIQLPINATTIMPKLKLQYSTNKEISFESLIQLQLKQSKFQMEVKSPFCKPITVNALYDISVPTKAALVTVRWDDKQMDLKSTVHLEMTKAIGVLVATRSDVEGPIVNAQFMYDISKKNDMSGHIKALYLDKKMEIVLSGGISHDNWEANCDLVTPFNNWEKLTAMLNVDLSKPTMMTIISISRNSENIALSGSALLTPDLSKLSLALTSSIPNVKSFSLVASVDESETDNHLLDVNWNYAGYVTQLTARLHLTADGLVEVKLHTPVDGFEDFLFQGHYKITELDYIKSWGFKVVQNDMKVEMESTCVWDENGNGGAEVRFQSTMTGLEDLSVVLAHSSVPIMSSKLVLQRNLEIVQLQSSFATDDSALTLRVECKTPITGYELLSGELMLEGNTELKSAALVLLKNDDQIKVTGDIKVDSLLNVEAHASVVSPYLSRETILIGVAYNFLPDVVKEGEEEMQSDKKGSMYVEIVGERNEINVVVTYLPSQVGIQVNVDAPVFIDGKIKIEGYYNKQGRSIYLQGNRDNEFVIVDVEIPDSALQATLLTSIIGFEKSSLTAFYELAPNSSFISKGMASMHSNNAQYSINMANVFYPSTPEMHLEIKTPILSWEQVNIDAIFDLTKIKKSLKFLITKSNEKYEAVVDWTKTDNMADCMVSITTPIRDLKQIQFNVHYNLTKSISAGILMQVNAHKMKGLISASDNKATILIETPWKEFRTLSLSGSFQDIQGIKSLIVALEKNKDKSQIDFTLKTEKDATYITINSPFNICRTLSISVRLGGLFTDKTVSLVVIKNSDAIVELSAKFNLDTESTLGFNINITSPLLPNDFEHLELSAHYDIQHMQKNIMMHIIRNSLTVIAAKGNILHAENGGFTYHLEIEGDFHEFSKKMFVLEYKPQEQFIHSALTSVKGIKVETYSGVFTLTNVSLQLTLSSPIQGYEHFSLVLKKIPETVVVDFSTTFLFFDMIKLRVQLFPLKSNDENFISLLVRKDQDRINAEWKLQLDTLFAKSSFSLMTPYSGYEKLGLNLEYDLYGKNKAAMIALEKNNKTLKIESILLLKGHVDVETSLNVTTSFTYFEDIKFYGSYDLMKSSQKNIVIMGHWNDDWNVDIKFKLENSTPTKAKIWLTSVTPYDESTFSITGTYDLSDPSKMRTIEGALSILKMRANFSAILEDQSKRGQLLGSFFKEGKSYNGNISWYLRNEIKQKSAQLVVDLGEGKKTVMDAVVNLDGRSNVSAHASFIDLFSNTYKLTADWSTSKYSQISKLAYQWSDDKQIVLENNIIYEQGQPFSANIKFTSPFTSMKSIEFQNKWSFMSNGVVKINSLLQFDQDRKIDIGVMLSKTKLMLSFDSPITEPVLLIIKLSSVLLPIDSEVYSIDSSFSYGSWKNQFNFDLSKLDDGSTIVDSTLRTPLEGITWLHMKWEMNVVRKEARLILEKEHQKWELSHSMSRNNDKHYYAIHLFTPIDSYEHCKLFFSYDVRTTLAIQIYFQLNEVKIAAVDLKVFPTDASLFVNSQIDGIPSFNVECVAKLTEPIYEIRVGGTVGNENFNLRASVDTSKKEEIVPEILFTSPWTDEFVLSGSYRHKTNHELKITLKNGEETNEFVGTLYYKSEVSKLEIEFDSSLNNRASLSFKSGYDWKQQLKKSHLTIIFGEATFHARSEGQVSEEGTSVNIHIDTPFKNLKLVEFKVDIEKKGYLSEKGSVLLRANTNVYHMRYSTEYTANSFDGHLTVASPIFQIQEAILNVKHGENYVYFTAGVDGKTCNFEGSYQLENPVSFLKFKLNAPFIQSLEHIEVAVDLNMNDLVFSYVTQWTVTKQINLAILFGIKDFNLRLQTPFTELLAMEVSSKILFTKDAYNLIGKVTLNEAKVDLDGVLTIDPFNIDVSAQAEWGERHEASGRTTYSSNNGKTSVQIAATVQGKDINIAGEIETADSSNLGAKINIQIPFYGIVPITAVASFKHEDWRELDVRVAIPNAVFGLQANYVLNNNDVKIGLEFDLPVIKSSMVIGGSFNNNDFAEVDGSIFINNNNIAAGYKLENDVFTGSFDMNAPFFNIEDTRVDIQASTKFNPDIHSSITYRYGKYLGSLSSSLRKSTNAFSVRLDVDLPSILGPLVHTGRLSATYLGPQYFVEVRLDDGRHVRSASLEMDSKTDWNVIGRAMGPTIDKQEVVLLLNRNWNLLSVNINNKLIFEAKRDFKSGSVVVEYAGQEHKLEYQLNQQAKKSDFSLHMESAALKAKTVTIGLLYENFDQHSQILVQCISGLSVNKASVQFINNLKTRSIIFDVTRTSERILHFDFSNVINNAYMQRVALLEWFGHVSKVSLKHSKKMLEDMEINVTSPYLKDGSLYAKLNVTNGSVTAYARLGEERLSKYMSLVVKFDPSEKIGSFEFQAPHLDVANTLKFNGVFKIYEDMFTMVSFNGYFASAYTSDAQISLGFLLSTAGIDTSIMILTPFVDYKLFKAAIQIPFLLSKNNDIHMSINLPKDIKYLLEAKFQNEADHFEMGILLEYEASKFGALVKLVFDPVPVLQLSLNTPFRLLKNYRVQFRGQNSLVDGDEIINYVEWSDKRIELRHSMIAGPKKVLYRVQLTTPFKGFERYVAGLHFQFDHHKKALITLGFPKLEEDWIIEFDYRFKNPRDLSFMTLVQAPIFTGFKVASFLIGNRFDVDTRTYRGILTGRYNEDQLSITLDGAVEAGGVNACMNAQLNGKTVRMQVMSGFQDRDVIDGLFELTSPFMVIKDFKITVRSSPYESQKLNANVIYNTVELINATVFHDENRLKTILVRNPWRSFSVAYLFDLKDDVAVRGEICWDTDRKLTSQLGGGFSLTKQDANRQDISILFKFPTREISINGSRQRTTTKIEYASSFSWDYEQTLGYRFMLERKSDMNWNTLCRLDLPFRSFEMTSHGYIEFETHSDVSVQVMWDAAINRSKKIGFTLLHSSNNVELTLEHSALKHPIILRLEQENWIIPVPDQPRTAKFILEYSPLPEDLLVVGTYVKEASKEDASVETVFNIRHEATSLDSHIFAQTSFVHENSLHKMGLSYIDSRGQKRVLEIYGKISNTRPAIEVSVKTSESSLAVNGSLWFKANGNRGITITLAMNQKEPLSMEGRINTEELSTEFDIGYGSSRKYMFSASVPSSRHIAVSVRHSIFGTPSVDGQFSLRLNTSRLIWTQIRWHQGLFEEMQRALLQEYSDVTLVAENIIFSFTEFLNEDFVGQFEEVCSTLYTLFEDIQPYSNSEINMIAEDFTEIKELFNEMYERNEFYLQDIHQLIKSSISYAQEKTSCLVKQILEVCGVMYSTIKNLTVFVLDTLAIDFNKMGIFFSEIQKMGVIAFQHSSVIVKEVKHLTEIVRKSATSMLVAARETVKQIDQLIDHLFDQISGYSTQLVDQYSHAMYPFINAVQQHTILMHSSFVAMERSLNELVVTVYNTLMSVKELRQVVELYDKYSSWMEEFRMQNCIDKIVQYFNTIGVILVEDFQRMIEDYRGYIDAALNVISSHLEMVDRVPAVAYTKHVVNRIHQKLAWLWHYHDLSGELQRGLHLLLENIDEIIAKLASDININEPSPQLDSNLVVRPGFIELRQHLPVDWDNFFELPKFSQLTTSGSPTTNFGEYDKYHTYVLNAVSKMRPTWLDTDFLPPYGSSGLLVGKQHIITFDNRFYDFEGECSYLLASHFVDNKFSVIVNYNIEDGKVVKKWFTVMSEGHRIDISSTYRITVDGVKTELPATVGNAVVMIRDGNRIILDSENQMSVQCNIQHNICSVRLSGWYFGKTGGLLGSFDNEPSNDMALPDGNVTSDLEKFTSGWRVGSNGRCRLINHATPMPLLPDSNSNSICNSYFADTNSPLATCFTSVNPKPFLSMCLSDVSLTPGNLGMCTATIAYALECAEAEVEVEVPKECVRCNVPNSPQVIAGESTKIEGNTPMSGDIVFVVEQADCIKNVNLAKLASKLDMAMVHQGLTDNRFAVVGFGGELFPPHTRTAKGEIWSNSRGMEKAFQGLMLSGSTDENDVSDVYNALLLASGLSFRAGVSKTVVLVQCSSCSSALDYGDMMGVLLDHDITLHLLEPSVIKLRGSATLSKAKVFGADLLGAYTARNVKSMSPSTSLLKEVILPTDHCSPLAFESNGTAFNLDRLTDSISVNKQLTIVKKFVDVWTRRVAQTAQPSLCQQCDCIVDKDAVGQIFCSKCVLPSLDQAITEWQSLVMENNAQIDAIHTVQNSDDLLET